MRRRATTWGTIAIAAYLAAAFASFEGGLLRVRPLYDGSAPPPPYRWVKPPPNLAATNLRPESVKGSFKLTKGGSEPFSVSTPDGQVFLILPGNAVKPKAGEKQVDVTIKPLDPATFGAPPDGLLYDGNAYEVEMRYAASGETPAIDATTCPPPSSGAATRCATVVLRFPLNATKLYHRDGAQWVEVVSQKVPLQLYGNSGTLGVFVATGKPAAGARKPPAKSKTGDLIAIGAGLLAVLAAVVIGRRRRPARRAPARKGTGKPPPPKK